MSFRFKAGGREDDRQMSMNPNKMDLGEPRSFGGVEDSSRGGRRPPFGRGQRPSPGREKPFGDRSRDTGGFGREDSTMRDRSPLRGGMDDRFPDRFKKDNSVFPKRDDMVRKDSGRPLYGDDNYRDRYSEGRSRFDGPGGFNPRFDSRDDHLKNKPLNYPNVPPKGYYNEGFPKPNECEIIVVNKQQRLYAESVEARIKQLGVLVDLLFLKDEALLTQTVDDIARRGSLFAIVISPQNETHGSVTINILYGTPQEHRNMPLDDALKLISRNFHDHIRNQKESVERERAERGPYVGVVPANREVQLLLRMLADGRWISQSELSSVIRYLTERRDKMQNSSQGDRAPIASDLKVDAAPLSSKNDTDVAQKEQDLQNRIINLMSQGAPAGSSPAKSSEPGLSQISLGANRQSSMGPNDTGTSPNTGTLRPSQSGIDDNQSNVIAVGRNQATNLTGKPNEPASSATYINFDNPSVQKALDNLMQSGPNLLKNITMSTTSSSSTSQNVTSKAPNSNMGPPSPIGGMGGPNRDMGGPNRDMGGPNRDMGGPNRDMGPPRAQAAMMDMGSHRGSGNMGPDMGTQRGPNNMGPDMGSQRGPNNMGPDMGSQRGPSNVGSLDMGLQRGSGGVVSEMGSQRGPDMGGLVSFRGPNMGPPRGSGSMSEIGGMGLPQRGGNIGPGLGHGLPNMGHGSNFSGSNQHNFPGPGNFPGSGPYNSNPNMMGNMNRPSYGIGNQGSMMGGGPRRY